MHIARLSEVCMSVVFKKKFLKWFSYFWSFNCTPFTLFDYEKTGGLRQLIQPPLIKAPKPVVGHIFILLLRTILRVLNVENTVSVNSSRNQTLFYKSIPLLLRLFQEDIRDNCLLTCLKIQFRNSTFSRSRKIFD